MNPGDILEGMNMWLEHQSGLREMCFGIPVRNVNVSYDNDYLYGGNRRSGDLYVNAFADEEVHDRIMPYLNACMETPIRMVGTILLSAYPNSRNFNTFNSAILTALNWGEIGVRLLAMSFVWRFDNSRANLVPPPEMGDNFVAEREVRPFRPMPPITPAARVNWIAEGF